MTNIDIAIGARVRELRESQGMSQGRLAAQPAPLPGEEWRPVVGYEATYMVSSLGRVWSRPRRATRGGILRTRLDKDGYPAVGLTQDGVKRHPKVHRLIGEAFLGALPEGMQTRHLDGNPLNCTLENLAYGTVRENCLDRRTHGTDWQVNKTHCPRGHELRPGNLDTAPSAAGSRHCLKCTRATSRATRQRWGRKPWECPFCGLAMTLGARGRHLRKQHGASVVMGDLP